MKRYIVVRSRFIGSEEIHSTEYFSTEYEALRRFSNIWATDINNDQTTWNGVFMFDAKRIGNLLKYEINDQRETKDTFLLLLRFFEKNGTMGHSVQYYYPDYVDPTVEYKKAVKRWFSVIAYDLDEEQHNTANGAVLFDSMANICEARCFE